MTEKRVSARKKSTDQAPGATGPWRQVNRLQLAALLGVHEDTVTGYSRSGMPVVTAGGRGKESIYDAVECLAWARAQQGRGGKDAAQIRALEASAKLNEQKLAQQRGALVSRAQVELEGQHYTRAWAAKVSSLPRRLRQVGAITTSVQEAQAAALCREVLTEIASWVSVADAKKAEADAA